MNEENLNENFNENLAENLKIENENLKIENENLKQELIKKNIEIECEKNNFCNFKENVNKILNYENENLIVENIKNIRIENEKKLNDLNENYNKTKNEILNENLKIKNLIKNSIENLLNSNENFEILNNIEKLEKKIFFLLEENKNKEKFNLILNEKYSLINEEKIFLKNLIISEKNNFLLKISEISKENNLNHFFLINDLLNELNTKKNDFFINFNTNFSLLEKLLNESKNSNEKLKIENENFKKISNDLNTNFNNILNEKNELLKKCDELTIFKEKKNSNEIILNSEIKKLKNENENLKKINENISKTNKILNENIEIINNKIEIQLNNISNENLISLSEKNNMINNLNEKILEIQNENNNNNIEIKEYKNEINKLNNEINFFIENENKFNNEINNLKNKIKEISIKKIINENVNNNIDEINKNYLLHIDYLKKEKINVENKLNNLNKKFIEIENENFNLKNTINNLNTKINEINNINLELKNEIENFDKKNELLLINNELLKNIQFYLKQIDQIHFFNNNNNNNNIKNEITILNEINEKLNMKFSSENNSIAFNEEFAELEQKENSQLYEMLILFLINLQSMNKIEIQKIFSELTTEINKKENFNNSYSNNITNLTSNVNTMSNYNLNKFDELKNVLEERYLKYEERIKNSVNINDFEKILIESKELYETIIENIFQVFYNNKTDLNQNKILTIQMPLEKYHQIINNTNTNLAHVDQGINKKITEFKNQGKKIENALKIIMKYVNNKS